MPDNKVIMCVNECLMSWLLGRQELLAILPLGVVWSTRITDGSLAACWVSRFLPKQHQHYIYIHTCIYLIMIALIIMPFIDRINVRYKLLGTYI